MTTPTATGHRSVALGDGAKNRVRDVDGACQTAMCATERQRGEKLAAARTELRCVGHQMLGVIKSLTHIDINPRAT